MGEVILLNKSTKNKSDYNWNYAFNNLEFIKFLEEHNYTPSYVGLEEEIDPYAYSGVTKFESVIFPNMWKNIGSHAFENCTNLVSASFYGGSYNNSNYKIDDYAFAGCYSLQYFSMVVPKNIGKRAFYNCSNLRYAYFFSAMRGNPSESYWMCDIDDEAFLDCKCTGFSLNYLGYVKRIGKRAFENCTFTSYYSSLVGYSICRRVDDEAFLNCSTMKTIQLNCYPLSYSTPYITCDLGKDIFKGCNNLYSITIGCLPSISSTAFGDTIKSTLKYIKIGISYHLASWFFDGYTDIGSHAFDGYSILSSVEISHIKSIGEYAFANCPSIQSIELHYSSPCSSIGAYAFYNCTSLSSFVIRSVVTYIGSHAFENCSLLQGFYSYSISNIEYIGEYAFYNCCNLGTGYYGSDTATLNNISYIGSHAFENCSTLSRIVLDQVSSLPILANINAFDNIDPDYKIYVSSALYQSFIDDSVWGLISDHIIT